MRRNRVIEVLPKSEWVMLRTLGGLKSVRRADLQASRVRDRRWGSVPADTMVRRGIESRLGNCENRPREPPENRLENGLAADRN
jgi:hypothetical protein